MKPFIKTFGGFIFLALIFTLFNSVFTVSQWEQKLVVRFGEPVRIENAWGQEPNAGLKFKVPFVDKVVRFDRRNLELDMAPQPILAADQERLLVDAFVRYRIVDAKQFYEKFNNREQAEIKMRNSWDSSLRDVLGAVDSNEIISGQRAGLMNEIQELANDKAKSDGWGLEVIDVRIRTADLPQENAQRVFARMRTDRERDSAEKRAEGEKEAITVRAQADRTVTVTLAKARETSEILKGEGDARRNAIFAAAHTLDPEFYAFYRSMAAYRASLKNGSSFVMSPDSDFLSYLDNQKGGRR